MENGLLGYPGQGPAIDLDPNTQLFTSSGIWTKPADCQWVRVILVGGGGGGGGGRRANTSRPSGGNGGGGGGVSFIDVPAGYLPNTVTVTIGAGGAGGNGATTANTDGSTGSAGGTSTFGDILSASGGNGGAGGQSATRGQGGKGLLYGGVGGFQQSGHQPTGPYKYLTTAGGGCGGSRGDQTTFNKPSFQSMATSPFSEPQKYGVLGAGGIGGAMNHFGTRTNTATAGTFGNGGGGGGGGQSTNNGENGAAGGDGYCLVVSYGTSFRPINVQDFTTSGTWTKPTDPRLTTARVFAIGAGGGGGSGGRWDRTNGAYLTGDRLVLSRNSGNYAYTPDSAALSITGDIDIKIKIGMFSWSQGPMLINNSTNTATTNLVCKFNSSQQSYALAINSRGALVFSWSSTGSNTTTETSTDCVNLSRYDIKWVRATMDVNNGAGSRVVKFYTSDDGTSWTQLGDTVTTSGTASFFDGTSQLEIGSINFGSNHPEANVYRAIIVNGYDGSGSVVFDANFETATAGATSFTESSVNAATVTISKTTTNNCGGSGGAGGGVSYCELPLAALPSTIDVTIGTGGAGAAGITTDYTRGNHGSYGGNTTFGSYLIALGGECGYGGNSSSGAVALGIAQSDTSSATVSYTMGSLTGGGAGGQGNSTAGGTGNVTDLLSAYMTSGGGGGGGITSAGATAAGGMSTKPIGYGTIISDTAATANGTILYSQGTGMFGSTGGGGGSSNGTINGGNGDRGSGGGGGAATTNGTTSGAGGNGGDGYVLVVCV